MAVENANFGNCESLLICGICNDLFQNVESCGTFSNQGISDFESNSEEDDDTHNQHSDSLNNILRTIMLIFEHPFKQSNRTSDKLKDWWVTQEEPFVACQKCLNHATGFHSAFMRFKKLINETSQLSVLLYQWSQVVTEVTKKNARGSVCGDIGRIHEDVSENEGDDDHQFVSAMEVETSIVYDKDLGNIVDHEEFNNFDEIGLEKSRSPSPVVSIRRTSPRVKKAKEFFEIASSSITKKSKPKKVSERVVKSQEKIKTPLLLQSSHASSSLRNSSSKTVIKISKKYKNIQKSHVNEVQKCDHCNKKFASCKGLNVHVRTCHSDSALAPPCRCTVCGQKFNSVFLLEKHIVAAHEEDKNKRKFYCPKCELSYEKLSELKLHFEGIHNEMLNFCMDCGKSFISKHHLTLHCRNIHKKVDLEKEELPNLDQVKVEIDDCVISSSSVSMEPGERNASHKKNERSKGLQCVHCNQVFRDKQKLRNHVLFHSENEPKFGCSQCPKRFFRTVSLNQHIAQVHSKGSKQYGYPCDDCGKVFTRKHHLKRHKDSHVRRLDKIVEDREKREREKMGDLYCCTMCDKTFTRKEYVVIHRRIHTGERPYLCSVCGKAFSDRRNLFQHQITHKNDRPYCCSVCGMTFKRIHHLRDHEKIHREVVERPFVCPEPLCGKAFKLRKHLATHELIHKDAKDHTCHVCGKSFRRKDNLKQHITNVHGKEFADEMLEMVKNQQLKYPQELEQTGCKKDPFSGDDANQGAASLEKNNDLF